MINPKLSYQTTSNQDGVHPDLIQIVRKHLDTEYSKPIPDHNKKAFDELMEFISIRNTPIVFDSGCGTGESSYNLGLLHQECTIIGIDKSAYRTSKLRGKHIAENNNVLVLRADVVDIWRLAEESGLKLLHHYLLYPNPWPKKKHLMRRWHAHPAFPSLLKLSGQIALRTDWEIYIEEFKQSLLCHKSTLSINTTKLTPSESPISPFEKKYFEQNRSLYQLKSPLSG